MNWLEILIGGLIIGAGAAGAIFLAKLAYDALTSWMDKNRRPDSTHATFIKEKLASGKVRIVGGVFNKNREKTATQTWEGELGDDLKQKFADRDTLTVRYT
ncbi:MAG: hypothetical protein LBR38_03675 [Synergistaceae bacterium]|jgi:hypothetical protein|nr:hypothetical protein [Synergistaceae bacterium]